MKKNPTELHISTGVSTRLRQKLAVSGYTKREREPNEALPPQIDKMAGKYVPEKYHLRPGSEDHLKIKSRGIK